MAAASVGQCAVAGRDAVPRRSETIELRVAAERLQEVRAALRTILTTWQLSQLADDCCLVAPELVTNADVHGGRAVRLTVAHRPPEVVLAVTDQQGSLVPHVAHPRPDAETGRGLLLVDAITSHWGVEALDGHKVVWAALCDGKSHEGPP